MHSTKIKTLLLYAQYSNKLSYFDDWREGFVNAQQFDTSALNICLSKTRSIVKNTINDYDLIVLLHSAIGDSLDYINQYKTLLQTRRCKLLTFVGNEVNLPGALLKDKITLIKEIQADYIGTQLPLAAGVWLYEQCEKSIVLALPHALNPEAFSETISQPNRKIDVGVRTYKYPPFLGDNDRNDLINHFEKNRNLYSLDLDINLSQRFNRTDWANFLNHCKSTIATEAGSMFLERDDKTMQDIVAYCKEKMKLTHNRLKTVDQTSILFKLRMQTPNFLKVFYKKIFGLVNETEMSYLVDYQEIYDKFFRNYPLNPVYTKAISSRHFDAIGTKTCQIMFSGKYNDILLADKHYIALNKDFSNIDECLKRMKDLDFRTGIVETAHEHILTAHTYRHRTNAVAQAIFKI